jgi:hypothetical protein
VKEQYNKLRQMSYRRMEGRRTWEDTLRRRRRRKRRNCKNTEADGETWLSDNSNKIGTSEEKNSRDYYCSVVACFGGRR